MSYEELKKLDKVSLKKLRDGQGPCDECICHILSLPPDPLTFGKVYRKIRCYIRRFTNPPPPERYDPKSKKKGKKNASPTSSRTSNKGKKMQGKESFDSASNMKQSSKKGSKYQAQKRPSKNKGVEVARKKKGCCRNCC